MPPVGIAQASIRSGSGGGWKIHNFGVRGPIGSGGVVTVASPRRVPAGPQVEYEMNERGQCMKDAKPWREFFDRRALSLYQHNDGWFASPRARGVMRGRRCGSAIERQSALPADARASRALTWRE